MKPSNPIKIAIGVFCILILLLVIAIAVMLDSQSPEPILGIFQTEPQQTQEVTEPSQDTTAPTEEATAVPTEPKPEDATPGVIEEEPTLPEDEPSGSVTLPTEADPETGEPAGISFPCQVPEYDLVIEKLAPYSGMFVEDGSNGNAENVAMLLIHNNGTFPVEYTQICVEYEADTLIFDISALPAGEKLVVQEKTGKTIPEGLAQSATAMVVRRAHMDMSQDQVLVTDNGDNTLTIQNLTDKAIPTVRIFYKHYMHDENLFVGGIAFTVRITRLAAGSSITIQPTHYTSQTSRVVMVLTYDSEV